MYIKKIMKLGIIACTAIVFTACGGGSDGNAAIDKLISYATTGEPVPTAADYEAAGVVGVTNDNVALANSIILGLAKEQVDTKEEVQALAGEGISFAPIAVIEVDKKTVPDNQSLVTFSASKSLDPDGTIVSYSWKRGADFVIQNIAEFSIAGKDLGGVGTYKITLTVTDNAGKTGTAIVFIEVTEDVTEPTANVEPTSNAGSTTNAGPTANAGPDQNVTVIDNIIPIGRVVRYVSYASQTTTGTIVLLDGSQSTPKPLSYAWTSINNGAGVMLQNDTTATPSFNVSCFDDIEASCKSIDSVCSILFELTVSDGDDSASDTVTINVDYTQCMMQPMIN